MKHKLHKAIALALFSALTLSGGSSEEIDVGLNYEAQEIGEDLESDEQVIIDHGSAEETPIEVDTDLSLEDLDIKSDVTYRFIVDGEEYAAQTAQAGEKIIRPEDPAAPEGKAFVGWMLANGTKLFVDGDQDGKIDPVIVSEDEMGTEVYVWAEFADRVEVEEQPEEQPTEEQPTEEQPAVEQPVEQPIEEPPVEQPAEEEPVEQPTEEQSSEEEQPAEEPPVEQPIEEQPKEEQPAEEQPVEQPIEEPPVEQPAEEQPVEQPTEEQPAEEEPTEEQPAEQPVEEQPEEQPEEPPVEQPAEEQPVEQPTEEQSLEQPAEEQPTEEPPVEQPTEEQPAEESPVEQPAEEQPVEEPTEEQPEEQPEEEQPSEEEQPAEEQPVEELSEEQPVDELSVEKPSEEEPEQAIEKPIAKALTYTGEAQMLVNAEGTWLYSLDGETYSTEIPTAINAGEYTVYFKAAEEDEPQAITIVVERADVEFTPPVAAINEDRG